MSQRRERPERDYTRADLQRSRNHPYEYGARGAAYAERPRDRMWDEGGRRMGYENGSREYGARGEYSGGRGEYTLRRGSPQGENYDPTRAQGMPNALRILIPDKSMKRVIGAGGENVRRIGNESSTFIHVSSKPFNTKDACTDHIVSISPRARPDPGSEDNNCDRNKWKHAIDQCSYAMMSVLREAFQTLDARGQFKCILLAPAHCAGLIIGSRGDRVGHVRKAFNVDIQLNKPPPDQYDEEVTFCGVLEDVARVVNMMNDVFQIYWPNVPEEAQRAAQIAQARLDKEGERRGRGHQNYHDGGGSYHDLKNYRDRVAQDRVAHDRDARRSRGAVEGPSPGVDSAPRKDGNRGNNSRGLTTNEQTTCSSRVSTRSSGPSGPASGTDSAATGAIASSCDHIPLGEQKERMVRVQVPDTVSETALLGKTGFFVRDLRARVESGGLGLIEDVSMENNEVVVRATEGVLPYVIAQIMDRIRNVENEC